MEASIRSHSLTLALLIHGAVFILLFFVVMRTAIPPFGQSSGSGNILVDISALAASSSVGSSMTNSSTGSTPEHRAAPSSHQERTVVTQDFEPSPVSQKQNQAIHAETGTITAERNNNDIRETQRTINTNALYRGSIPTGTPHSTTNAPGHDGANENGTSAIHHGGIGPVGPGGHDPLIGMDGTMKREISAIVPNRNMIVTPNIEDRTQETGKVVVGIAVDQSGNVISATPGYRGSTTTSSYLFSKAKEAAMKARFNPSDDGADIQKGTITFVFVVQ